MMPPSQDSSASRYIKIVQQQRQQQKKYVQQNRKYVQQNRNQIMMKSKKSNKSKQHQHKHPHQLQKKKEKKRVRFATTGSRKAALHLSEYTKSEFQSSFYSSSELFKMKEDVENTVLMMSLGKHIDEIKYSVRGVDYVYTDEAMKLRHKRRKESLLAVLSPSSPRSQQRKSQDKISTRRDYGTISQECAESAQRIGFYDELFVKSQRQQNKKKSPSIPPPPPPSPSLSRSLSPKALMMKMMRKQRSSTTGRIGKTI